ncbi:hypothetical protein C2G38_2213980 [Gigaspora rosea]|uniref:F-box/LRR-repeat protein 15-like leucin rich repeat domain-containing protein n=1 Tax=Gigaspora rosea TaxID=44941 RepID=A0A397UBF0_9GLOM|nr:hypothetical protein C2G38_2213976 [Gigaspora rosea]RIB07610.1 hypothetical protein C2G38_2213980 [Gigaspora rosea]
MKYLNISYCKNITDKSIYEIAESCHSLEFLYIAGLKYINESIAHLSPNIRYLDLAFCHNITNGVISKIARLYSNLEYIDLSGCKNITDVSICDIAHYCQKLEHFDISSCDISDLAIEKIATSSNNLKFLNIQLCGGISENAVKKLNSNIKVKGID